MARAASCLIPLHPSLGLPASVHIRMSLDASGELSTLGARLLAGSAHFERQRELAQIACGSIPLMDPATGHPTWLDAASWSFCPPAFDPPPGSPFHTASPERIESMILEFAAGAPFPAPLARLLSGIPVLDRIGEPDGLGFGSPTARLDADVDAVGQETLEGHEQSPSKSSPRESFPILSGAASARLLAHPDVDTSFSPDSDYAYLWARGRWLTLCSPEGPSSALASLGAANGAWLPVSQLLARFGRAPSPSILGPLSAYLGHGPTAEDMEDLLGLWRMGPPTDFFKGDSEISSRMENASLAREIRGSPLGIRRKGL